MVEGQRSKFVVSGFNFENGKNYGLCCSTDPNKLNKAECARQSCYCEFKRKINDTTCEFEAMGSVYEGEEATAYPAALVHVDMGSSSDVVNPDDLTIVLDHAFIEDNPF